MIALAIAALGIAAVAKATGGAATVAGHTRQRMVAVWVAANRLSELRITRAWPAPGTSDGTSTMGGRTWYLARTVRSTRDPGIRRVEMSVYTDPELRNREYQAFGYVARYKPPTPPVQGSGGGGAKSQGSGNGTGSAGTGSNGGQAQ